MSSSSSSSSSFGSSSVRKSSFRASGASKMRIKPFARPPAPPADLYERATRELFAAADAVLLRVAEEDAASDGRPASPTSVALPRLSREELYRSVEDLCVHGHGGRLWADVRLALERGARVRLAAARSAASGPRLLERAREAHGRYAEYLVFVRSVFLVLDRARRPTDKGGLWEAGVDAFKREMDETTTTDASSLLDAVIDATVSTVRRERNGEAVDRSLLRNITGMLAELPGVFKERFVPRLTAESRDYFRAEGHRLVNVDKVTLPHFLEHVERRWNQAHDMSLRYLDRAHHHPSSSHHSKNNVSNSSNNSSSHNNNNAHQRSVLTKVVESELVEAYVESFLLHEKHLHPLLNDDAKLRPDGRRLYVLLRKIDRLDELRRAFARYGRGLGDGILLALDEPQPRRRRDVVPALLAWRRRLRRVHEEAFAADDALGDGGPEASRASRLRAVAEDVLNGAGDDQRRRSAVAELLSAHADALLRSPRARGVDALGDVVELFRHSQAKDVFEAFARRDLARRLLTRRSASADLERTFVSMLKTECGPGYTHKMEGMFQDTELSKEVAKDYERHRVDDIDKDDDKDDPLRAEVQILTTGYWPSHPQIPTLKLPPPFVKPLRRFEEYYRRKHQGRRVTWQHSLGQCVLKANFPHGAKDLQLTQYQAMLLLWAYPDDDYDKHDGWTIKDVMGRAGMRPDEDRAECERALLSLSRGRDGARVLLKDDDDDDERRRGRGSVSDDDKFRFHRGFRSRQQRIRIPVERPASTAEERSATHENVARDRLHIIDAAIVRVMKTRRTVDHHTLVSEVMNQLRFSPSGADVKKRIASLMEREYMERNADNRDSYNYLA